MSIMMTQKCFAKGSEYPALKKDTLRLYSMRFCPFAQRTRLVLAHKQIQHETINIHLSDKPAWFLERNPLGMVPTLECNTQVIYESGICDEYLDEKYPDKPLLPKDPYEKAQIKILMEHFSKLIPNFYKFVMSTDDGEKKVVQAEMVKQQALFDKTLQGKKFFGGDCVNMLDFHLWPWYERFHYKSVGDEIKSTYPNTVAWMEAMRQIPAVKEAAIDDETFNQVQAARQSGMKDVYDFGL